MIDYTELRSQVESYIADNFDTCPIKFENVNISVSTTDTWIAIFDKVDYSTSMGMGEDVYMSGGLLTIQIFTPLGQGTQVSRSIANELTVILSNVSVGDMTFEPPELRPAPQNESWYQQNLIFPYTVLMGQESSNC